MSKKSAKMGLTYVITILLTLVIAGGVCWYMFESMLFGGEQTDNRVVVEEMSRSEEYTPSKAENRTILLILDAEKRESGSCFLAVRFLPAEEQVVLMPIPSNTLAESDGASDTLYNIYRNGGSTAAVNAITSCTGVKFDKHIKFNSSSFSTIVDIFGGVDFDIPYNLIYSNSSTGEETVIKQGRNHLDSELLKKVLTYPNYKSGEEYRAKCLGVTATDMLNSNIDEVFATHLDDYFNLVMNSDIETDITAYDYDEIAEAMKYVCKNSYNPASFVLSTGTTDENGAYTLDENFVKAIPEFFKTAEENEPVLE